MEVVAEDGHQLWLRKREALPVQVVGPKQTPFGEEKRTAELIPSAKPVVGTTAPASIDTVLDA